MKAIVAIVICVLLCSLEARGANGGAALQASLRADLNKYLTAHSKDEHISAISLSVNAAGSSDNINVTAGQTQYGGRIPVTASNLFQIGSNTKAFTAVTILQLEAAGKLSINDPLGKWLPQYPAWKTVTILRLLNMTSGIPSYDTLLPFATAWGKDVEKTWTPAQLASYAYPQPGKGPKPTTGYNYSNTNYILAQMIIERATGRTYADELRTRFFKSNLGLNDTYYEPAYYPKSVTDRLVSGYFSNNDHDPVNAPLVAALYDKDIKLLNFSWAQGAGGIVSTPEDVTRWSRALYEGGLIHARQRKELMTLVSTTTSKPIARTSLGDRQGFGLGVVEMTLPSLGTFWFYQGESLGYRVVYVWLPSSGTVYAIGVNSQPTKNHIGDLMQAIYRTLHAAGKA